ncbi:MAG: hypothetical protein JO122_02345 [Acetobacteraceae bacterium]|nr:hypothetical protein [Acetobacteraceae bacterium]
MPPSAAADRFALIIGSLLQAVAEQGGKRIPGPLTKLIWSRLRRMVARFAAIAAAVHAGTFTSSSRPNHSPSFRPNHTPSSRPKRSAEPGSSDAAPPSPRGHSTKPHLPTRFAWLLRLAQAPKVACCRSQFIHFLWTPEVLELLAAAPQVGRMLRGLCRMLGVKFHPTVVPPALILARRKRQSRVQPERARSEGGAISEQPSEAVRPEDLDLLEEILRWADSQPPPSQPDPAAPPRPIPHVFKKPA